MSVYVAFNAALLIVAALVLRFVTPPADRVHTLRTGVFVTVLAFPWDFFAIQTRAWSYPIPHATVWSVPVNDLVFIFIASVISAGLLSRYVMPEAVARAERTVAAGVAGGAFRDASPVFDEMARAHRTPISGGSSGLSHRAQM